MTGLNENRELLGAFFRAGLQAVGGRRCVRSYLEDHLPGKKTTIISIGKAASAMALGAADSLKEQLHGGLVISKPGHFDRECIEDTRLVCLEAGHPLPDARSLAAGEALINFLNDTPPTTTLLFLISGGASSLVETLVDPLDLEKLRELNVWLLGSGLDIHRINRIRQVVSGIKGGKLRRWIGQRKTSVLMISDVADNSPDIIGSGLLAEPRIIGEALTGLPDWVVSMLSICDRNAAIEFDVCNPVPHTIVADMSLALTAASDAATDAGFSARVVNNRLSGDAVESGREIMAYMDAAKPGVYFWGGETTIQLPANPGRGGRCQSLALSAAQLLDGRDDIILLSAGTDGTDGPGNDAGAIIDGGTIGRGQQLGMNSVAALNNADAGTFLEASGDLVITGATGTNVTDMIIAMKMDTGLPGG